jgi:hypothetical protein
MAGKYEEIADILRRSFVVPYFNKQAMLSNIISCLD